jgi:hypothetical protein
MAELEPLERRGVPYGAPNSASLLLIDIGETIEEKFPFL